MDFDPLSLFTPAVATVEDEEQELLNIAEPSASIYRVDSGPEVESESESEEALDEPVHFLDLPLLQLSPPNEVLLLFLKLLAPEQVHNFSKESTATTAIEDPPLSSDIFTEKDVEALVPAALPWLCQYCPRFNSAEKLIRLPSLSGSLKSQPSYNSWLTKVISTPTASDDVLKQGSLRISENCGRTAQPEIIRKITIPDLEKFGKSYISLREPSLTSDNLGLKTWGSSLILSSRLVKSCTSGKSKYMIEPILELGSGTGLVGIVASLLGYETILTDLKEIVPNLQANIDLNEDGAAPKAQVEELDWTNPAPFVSKAPSRKNSYKTIILSDPIYSSQHPYWVVDMISVFLSVEPNARVLIQIPLRPKYEQERALLWRLLDKSGFVAQEEEIEDGFDDFGEMKFCFKQLKRKQRDEQDKGEQY
ncbi:protein-lysine N-methyltransferase Efm2p [[Candida] railenensis]|uniref:Protein-lysine N-methyltransferase Efm2p n=1 Tax=[Candida] railenensis TaxID=45579 RepID=A0A9P0QU07_9ASCO|nr:protein-lysine N-methyltransferase Efm2p [[Candida] railenensis]